jgi:peptidoglycan/LPS O-acetylase OafA/YrhL
LLRSQAWSLGIEEKFYLLWPLVAFVWLARSEHRLSATLVLLASTLFVTAATGEFAQVWGSASDILIGCALAFVMHDRKGYARLSILGRADLTWVVLAVLATAAVGRLSGTQLGDRLFSLAAAATIAALVTNTGLPARFASHPWLTRVGAWSCAIYLTHPLAFDVWNRLLPAGRLCDCLTLVFTCATDFPLCWLLYTWVEKPLLLLGRSVASRVEQSALRPS